MGEKSDAPGAERAEPRTREELGAIDVAEGDRETRTNAARTREDLDASAHEGGGEHLRALGEIVAEVAHELRNVLQVISANAYVARVSPGAAGPHLNAVERSARVAHAIVDDILQLARNEPLFADGVDVREVIELARADAPPSFATVVWTDDVAPDARTMKAHARLVARALHALYANAVEAAPAEGPPRITTRVRASAGNVVLEVHDHGPGVPAEIAAHVHEPLVTARHAGKGPGTGLGLALATRIARAHGGSLVLVPPSPREPGATFRLTLPA